MMGLGRRGDRTVLGDAEGRRAMVWIMAIMIFLTTLAVAVGIGATRAGSALDRQLAGRLTVQVVDGDADRRDRTTAAILARLGASGDVARVEEVDRERLAALLEPWLGEAGLDADLPMPAMIDVDLAGGDAAAARVERLARAAGPNVRIDRHATWLTPVRSLISTLGWAALGAVALIATATAAVVLLAARAGLDTHRGTIDVLHMLGSTDLQIARLFQRRIARDTLLGGAIGAGAGIAASALMGREVAALGSELAGGVVLAPADWLAVAALPLAFALLATVAARVAVVAALRRVL